MANLEAQGENEIWKPIPGYEGSYSVSNQGRVRSEPRKVYHNFSGKKIERPGRLLNPSPHNKGYLRLYLSRDGAARSRYVHRLVMLAFVGPCPEGKEVNHINGDKTDNRLENLEYVDHRRNVDHSWETSLCTHNGERHYKTDFTPDDIREIRRRYVEEDVSYYDLADEYNVSRQCIGGIIRRERWAHIE